MPQSPSVLVAVGAHEAPKVPNQKYKNIFTEYNIQQITKVSDADFYNRVVTKPNIITCVHQPFSFSKDIKEWIITKNK